MDIDSEQNPRCVGGLMMPGFFRVGFAEDQYITLVQRTGGQDVWCHAPLGTERKAMSILL